VKRLRIGLDIDDTMINAVDTVTTLNNKLYGTTLGREDWFNNVPEVLSRWGLRDGYEVTDRVHELMAHSDYLATVAPVHGARETVSYLQSQGHDLFAVTSRPERIRRETLIELDICFPGIFSSETLFMIDAFSGDPTSASVTKFAVAKQLRLEYFVDDLPVHANALAKGGVKSLLFSDNYSWNQDGVHHTVVRFTTWKDIRDYIDDQARD